MKQIQFDKTICGVDFLLNVLSIKDIDNLEISSDIQAADFFQIIFIKKGRGYIRLNEKKITISDHSVVFISSNQIHQSKISRDCLDASFLVFQEDFLNEFFADSYFTYRLHYFYQTNFPLKIQLPENTFDDYIASLNEVKYELKNPKSDSVHVIRSILYYLLIQLNRSYSSEHNITSAISQDNTAYQFRMLVEKHIKQKQRVEDYTELMHTSRITLNKMVKKHFNLTATDFIKSRLIFELKMQLIYTHKSIAELANEYHFSEPNHLTRFFKSRVGFTPVQFRYDYQNGSY